MDIPNVKKRVTEDTLKIDGRTFKLKSFDPFLGTYILVKLYSVALPFGIGDALKAQSSEKIPTAGSSAPPISKADFIELQRDILGHVYEVLAAGETPVVRENGTYGVELTMGVSIQLLIASIAFNFNDFFGANPSSD